jgi:hypothetical protein
MAEDEDIRRARQARALIAARQNAQPSTLADSLAALQGSVAEGKEFVKGKNVEIATIALETAVNSGDITAIQNAANALGKAQGKTGSELRTFAYQTAQTAAKGEKPEDPPADDEFTYKYVWRQDVGGPGGQWVLTKTPNLAGPDWYTDSNGMLFFKGKPFTGTKDGIQYVGGKGPGYKETGSGNKGPSGPTGSTTPTTYTAPDGKIFTDLNAYNAYVAQLNAEAKRKAGQSAYDLLFQQFNQYGLGALVEPLKAFIQEGLSQAEFTLRLRDTDAYKKRFAANAQRVKAGLRALSEAEYITLEDQYQNVMRNYGLPASYYTRGEMGRQEGFEKFIGGDVSAAELEDRIQTAQNRVINAAPDVSKALRQFFPEITNGDILAYVLDPENSLGAIKRKVTISEIGGAAFERALKADVTRASELAKYGVTGQRAREGYQAIAEFLPTTTKLSDIYQKQGLGEYGQAAAEEEVFGIAGAADAAAKRRKLAQLESATFSGQVGRAGSALGRERAGQF